jgi:hypothetical protein
VYNNIDKDEQTFARLIVEESDEGKLTQTGRSLRFASVESNKTT